jgi:hypothetical protein
MAMCFLPMLCNDVPLPGEDEEAMLSEAFYVKIK